MPASKMRNIVILIVIQGANLTFLSILGEMLIAQWMLSDRSTHKCRVYLGIHILMDLIGGWRIIQLRSGGQVLSRCDKKLRLIKVLISGGRACEIFVMGIPGSVFIEK